MGLPSEEAPPAPLLIAISQVSLSDNLGTSLNEGQLEMYPTSCHFVFGTVTTLEGNEYFLVSSSFISCFIAIHLIFRHGIKQNQ